LINQFFNGTWSIPKLGSGHVQLQRVLNGMNYFFVLKTIIQERIERPYVISLDLDFLYIMVTNLSPLYPMHIQGIKFSFLLKRGVVDKWAEMASW
jgi:hypothetical protein